MPEILESGVRLVVELVAGLLKSAPQIVVAAGKLVVSLYDAIKNVDWLELGASIIRSILEGIGNLRENIKQSAVDMITGFVDKFKNTDWAQVGYDIGYSVVSGILSTVDRIKQTASDIVNTIKGFLQRVPGEVKEIDWVDLGKDVIRGIIDGISSMASALWDAAKSVARGALNGMRKAFDSHSPSKEAEKIAATVPQGLKKEWDSDTLAEDAAEKLGSRAIASLTADVNYRLHDVGNYAKSLTADFAQSYHGSTEITVPLYLDGREVARASAWWTGEQLSWEEM